MEHMVVLVVQRLAGTSAVQTFICQIVVLSKINRLTLKAFEQKYVDLRLRLCSPANYTIQHTCMNETLYR